MLNRLMIIALSLVASSVNLGCVDASESASGSNTTQLEDGLIPDPSFEIPMARDQQGRVFAKWDGWNWSRDCEFRVSTIARTGKHACLLFCANRPKIRISREHKNLAPGRYRITGYIRGLDIGMGEWGHAGLAETVF